jgi:hypothetical protein
MSRIKIRVNQALQIALLLLFTSVLLLPSPTAAQSVRRTYIKLLTLTCYETEDSTGSDEAVLKVFGTRYAEFYQSMNNTQTWDLNIDVPFNQRVRLELWDRDLGHWPDYHDLLGIHYANAVQAGSGPKTAVFSADDAYYVLTYEVVRR